MKNYQIKLIENALALIMGYILKEDLTRAGKACKVFGAILEGWGKNGYTRVYRKDGTIKKKYQKSK